MKKFISLSVSLLLTLLLAAGLFSVTPFAAEEGFPEDITLQTTELSLGGGGYFTTVSFKTTEHFAYKDFSIQEDTIILSGNTGGTLNVLCHGNMDSSGSGSVIFAFEANEWEELAPGEYTGEVSYSYVALAPADDEFDESLNETITGTIKLTVTKGESSESSEDSSEAFEESSEESSEAEDPSEDSSEIEESSEVSEESSEESTEVEESSEPEESSESEESEEESSEAEETSEEESSESSKTSKTSNPGKPDTLTMGGSTAASASGDDKAAPDTGFGNAPLIALGVAAMAGLAVLAFRKK